MKRPRRTEEQRLRDAYRQARAAMQMASDALVAYYQEVARRETAMEHQRPPGMPPATVPAGPSEGDGA